MSIRKVYRDALAVAADILPVLEAFADVPNSVAKLANDVWAVVRHRDPVVLQAVVADARELAAEFAGDASGAGPALAALAADLEALAADL